MTHQEFIETATSYYRDYIEEIFNGVNDFQVYTMLSVKVSNNSKVILCDNLSEMICEATLKGSDNKIFYDFYKKVSHYEGNA